MPRTLSKLGENIYKGYQPYIGTRVQLEEIPSPENVDQFGIFRLDRLTYYFLEAKDFENDEDGNDIMIENPTSHETDDNQAFQNTDLISSDVLTAFFQEKLRLKRRGHNRGASFEGIGQDIGNGSYRCSGGDRLSGHKLHGKSKIRACRPEKK